MSFDILSLPVEGNCVDAANQMPSFVRASAELVGSRILKDEMFESPGHVARVMIIRTNNNETRYLVSANLSSGLAVLKFYNKRLFKKYLKTSGLKKMGRWSPYRKYVSGGRCK